MRLDQLLENIYDGPVESAWRRRDISSITCDSRKAQEGSLFVALQGTRFNGEDFIREAVRRGARVVVGESLRPETFADGILFLQVKDANVFLRQILQRFYGPAAGMVKTIGVTGTNGKTTVTYFIESILREAGENCGVIGTVNYRIGETVFPSPNTTPGIVESQRFLADLAKNHIGYCVMEVSSHGLAQGRVDLINFKTAVFTNLTSDHLDYHGNREDYFSAKAGLFTHLPAQSLSVINIDDAYGRRLMAMTPSRIVTYGLKEKADVTAMDIEVNSRASRFKLRTPSQEAEVSLALVGRHNIYNALAAAAAGLEEKIPLPIVVKGLERLDCVPGRLERVEGGQDFSVFIDYAHTQDALENVLTTLREVTKGRIILVFGCGGDRDKTKRPQMGETAGRLADVAIVTTDNPRSEDPRMIINQITAGFRRKNYEVVIQREEAIQKALSLARGGDAVLIAGKGHEDYQIFKDKTIEFHERDIVRAHLKC